MEIIAIQIGDGIMKFKDLFKYLEFSDSTRVYNVIVKTNTLHDKSFTTIWKEIKLNWCCTGELIEKYKDTLISSDIAALYVTNITFNGDEVIITLSDTPE